MKRRLMTVAIAVVVAFALILALAMPVSADVTVTPAGGGDTIAADDFGTGTYTDLGSIVIAEGVAGDIGEGTIILNVPTGFEFRTAPAPDVAVTGATPELVATFTSITTTQITITVTTASTTETDTLTIGGVSAIGVRPTQGTPLASGNIVMDAASTSTIAGVTPGTTNFGTLTEVHGAATKFVIINPTDGTVDAAITVTVQLQDQYGNIVTTGADKDKDVTLNADGSATGDGLVDVTDGVGTIAISDQVAQTVNLTLSDSEGTGFDVSSTQDVVFAHGAINYYTVTSASYTQAAGTAFTVTVIGYDQYGNLASTDSSTQVTMFSSSATMAFDGDGNGTFGEAGDDSKMLSAGTFDIQARDTSGGIGVTITATDSNAKTGISSPYSIYALGGGGGGGAPPPPPSPPSPAPLELEVNLWGDITSVEIGEDGALLESVTATSPDGSVTLTIATGTQMLGPDGNPLAALTVETVSDPPGAGDGYHVIAAFDFGPDGTTCNPSMEITIAYDPSALPEGVDEANLVIAYYDESAGEWAFVTGEVDPAANTVTFSAGHFTTFAILAAAAAPEVTPSPALSSPSSEGGLSSGVWAGIGIGIIAVLGLPIWVTIRRLS